MKTLAFIACLIVAAVAHDPIFQGQYLSEDTPSYDLICSTSEYDVRKVHQSHWASVTVDAFSRTFAQLQALKTLRGYAAGGNSAGTEVKMGNPILTQILLSYEELKRVREGQVGQEIQEVTRRAYSVAAHLPDGTNTPEPNNDEITIDEIPELVVFVKDLGGLPRGGLLLRNALFLAQSLRKNQEAFDPSSIYIATYLEPNDIGRFAFIPKNEVWFIGSQAVSPACEREGFVDHNVHEDDKAYTVLQTFDNGVELREYETSSFVVLTAENTADCQYKDTILKAFVKLRRFFILLARFVPDWQPEQQQRRVIFNVNKFTQPDEFGCEFQGRLWFPVVDEEKAERAVQIAKWRGFNPQIVKDKTFSGYAFTFDGYARVEGQGKRGVFRDALDSLGVSYDKNNFVLVLHNKQSQLFGRRNDIVYPAVQDNRFW